MIWDQCQDYIKKPIMLLLQVNNMDASGQKEFKHRLQSLGLRIKYPKPGILCKVLRQSQYKSLAEAIIGPTYVAVSKQTPQELQAALHYIAEQRKIFLVAGKVASYVLSYEGLREVVYSTPSEVATKAMIATTLMSTALEISRSTNQPASALFGLSLGASQRTV